jgi:hypothetical protein
MENEDHGGRQDQPEDHSLPGTNQAGTGPSSTEGTPGPPGRLPERHVSRDEQRRQVAPIGRL